MAHVLTLLPMSSLPAATKHLRLQYVRPLRRSTSPLPCRADAEGLAIRTHTPLEAGLDAFAGLRSAVRGLHSPPLASDSALCCAASELWAQLALVCS